MCLWFSISSQQHLSKLTCSRCTVVPIFLARDVGEPVKPKAPPGTPFRQRCGPLANPDGRGGRRSAIQGLWVAKPTRGRVRHSHKTRAGDNYLHLEPCPINRLGLGGGAQAQQVHRSHRDWFTGLAGSARPGPEPPSRRRCAVAVARAPSNSRGA